MHLIPAKCPDCGADIKIPDGSTQVKCEYCGGTILITDLLGSTSLMQNCMTLAYTAINEGNYKDAYQHFNRAIEIDMKNPYAIAGLAVCTGMVNKINDKPFNRMIELFERAFSYADGVKQQYLKKNASSEIVKVIKKNKSRISLDIELLNLSKLNNFLPQTDDKITKLKTAIQETVQKACEYDPENKEASSLLQEISSGSYFKSGNENMEIPGKSLSESQVKIQSEHTIDANKPTVKRQAAQKSGCSLMILIFILAISAGELFL